MVETKVPLAIQGTEQEGHDKGRAEYTKYAGSFTFASKSQYTPRVKISPLELSLPYPPVYAELFKNNDSNILIELILPFIGNSRHF